MAKYSVAEAGQNKGEVVQDKNTSGFVCGCNRQEVYIWEEFPQTAKCGGKC